MSAIVNVHEAKTHFSRLIERAYAGEDIVVAKAGKPMVRLVRVDDVPRVKRTPGGWPELAMLADESAMESAMSKADIDAWEQKLRDM